MYLSVEERREGIGGSDVGSIMGANPYCSPIEVFKQKVGDSPPPEMNYAMEWGSRLEDVIGGKYAEENNLQFDIGRDCVDLDNDELGEVPSGKNGILFKPYTLRSDKHAWAYAHPDFLVKNHKGEISGIEIKTVGEGIYRKYWAEDSIPPYQYYQVVWYSMITGINKWTMVGFVPHLRNSQNPVLTHEIEVDYDTQRRVWKAVEYFWDCVQKKTPPVLENYTERDIKILYPENIADLIKSNNTVEQQVYELANVRNKLKPLLEQEEVLKNSIKAFMGGCGRLIAEDGTELATFKNSKTKVSTDHKKAVEDYRKVLLKEGYSQLKDELENVLDRNTKAFVGARRFLLKHKGGA